MHAQESVSLVCTGELHRVVPAVSAQTRMQSPAALMLSFSVPVSPLVYLLHFA